MLLQEWRKILRFRFRGTSFVAWIQGLPELTPAPWNTPSASWLYDLVQLWRFEVQQVAALDHRIFVDKLAFWA